MNNLELNKHREDLKLRFKHTFPAPGTRMFHQYVPLTESIVGAKKCSENQEFYSKHNLLSKVDAPEGLHLCDFVACIYDKKWWVGFVLDVNDDDGDVLIKFMHPHGPSRSFSWPNNDDICLVPVTHVLCNVDPPTTATGRQYILTRKDVEHVANKFGQM